MASLERATSQPCAPDTYNLLSACLAKLCPASVAGVPWGLNAVNGSPSPPPNQPLLSSFWLLLQWESPALSNHLQRGNGVASLCNLIILSSLSTISAPRIPSLSRAHSVGPDAGDRKVPYRTAPTRGW